MPPTYEYECPACDHLFEEFQSMTDPPLRRCPKCGKRRLRRLLGTGAGIIFKGSGFYETDYKRKAAAPPSDKGGEKKEKREKKAPEGKADAGKDSKEK